LKEFSPPLTAAKSEMLALYLAKPWITYKEDPSEIAKMMHYGHTGDFIRILVNNVALSKAGKDSNATCVPGSDASSNLSDVAQGNYPLICSANPNCTKNSGCSRGGSSGKGTLSLRMLNGIINVMGNYGNSFTITSLTGGIHPGNTSHYDGVAVDIVPNTPNGNVNTWQSLRDSIKYSGGASTSKCEFI